MTGGPVHRVEEKMMKIGISPVHLVELEPRRSAPIYPFFRYDSGPWDNVDLARVVKSRGRAIAVRYIRDPDSQLEAGLPGVLQVSVPTADAAQVIEIAGFDRSDAELLIKALRDAFPSAARTG